MSELLNLSNQKVIDQGAFSPVFLLIFCKFYLPFIPLMAAFPFLCSQSRSHVFLVYLKKSCHQFLPYPRSSIISFSPDSNKIKLLKYAHSPFSCCPLLPALLTMKLWEWNYLVLFPISDCQTLLRQLKSLVSLFESPNIKTSQANIIYLDLK